MAGARSGRARPTKSYADSDAESAIYTDTEETAARPARNGVKRRLSEYVDGDGTENASFASTENGGRPPLKSVNMNDDAAEKRRRRKSAKIVLPTGDEPEAHVGAPDENAPQPGKGLQRLQSVAQVPIANVPLESMDVMSSNFEEWMKMATDNVSLFSLYLRRFWD
jgi:condensin complex subunit 2